MSAKDEKKAVDLGLLDEDDEFEEFPAEGKCLMNFIRQFVAYVDFDMVDLLSKSFTYSFVIEWDAKQEDQTDVNVWEDNWDDDAVEDDFSVQLRSELENQGMKMES